MIKGDRKNTARHTAFGFQKAPGAIFTMFAKAEKLGDKKCKAVNAVGQVL